jgi:hypothetical protein
MAAKKNAKKGTKKMSRTTKTPKAGAAKNAKKVTAKKPAKKSD